MSDAAKPAPKPAPKPSPQPSPQPLVAQPLIDGDFYYDGPYMVFTAAYHTRRGYCCNSDCRHCPYRE